MKREKKRRLCQIGAAVAFNAYLPAFFQAGIFQGKIKGLCFPALNCYSCPSALGACPIGSLQASLASIRLNLEAGQRQFGLYVIGFLTIVGSLVGRLPCGWLCPFGLFQELIHRKKGLKVKLPRFVTYGRYLVLLIFVIFLPLLIMDKFGLGQTWFCKWICPAGTLEAGLPLILLNENLRSQIGFMFSWKVTLLFLLIGLLFFIDRAFCRTTCPLGAIWGLFNRASLFQMAIDENHCVRCLSCQQACPVEIDPSKNPNSPDCIRCLRCLEACPSRALSYSFLIWPRKTKPVSISQDNQV
ncbi:MAG: 4Fe-4S binding protein [Candidatus Aminicenantes bacterium]|nr:4Fe-4S binding protein [Candidatus Aminicenantes bacterium]